MQKRGQVTIFIIIAILIIFAAILIYMLIPKVKTEAGFDAQNPSGFIHSCLQNKIEQSVELISKQGGSINPDFYYMYKGDLIQYLCYTAEYYLTCVVQQPMLKQHIESEIKKDITDEVAACFNNLEKSYQNNGYTTKLDKGDIVVELLPKRISIRFENYTLTVSKGETSVYNSFSVILNNNLYELTGIANSIIAWETAYGSVETSFYMTYYRDLKVEKKKQDDGTTIYILTDRNTEKKFQFASRSVAWPPGYGTGGIAT